jgi:hypothetical protein
MSQISDQDRARVEEITGEEFTTLAAALDQWEAERQALADFNDENQALLILIKRTLNLIDISEKFLKRSWNDSALFFTPKARELIIQFWDEKTQQKNALAQSREIVKEHKT